MIDSHSAARRDAAAAAGQKMYPCRAISALIKTTSRDHGTFDCLDLTSSVC
jgi:hypothetical protein